MRLISTPLLQEGDIIGRDVVSPEGSILLKHDTRFKEAFKNKLLERGILEVYIEDEVSEGIEPVGIISQESKQIIMSDIKAQYESLKNHFDLDIETLTKVTSLLMEELMQKDLVFELDDIKTNDNYTYEHCIAVAMMSHMVCDKLMIPIEQKKQIVLGALIHDIGKVIIPKDILNKPGKLTDEEYMMMKTHSEIGYSMIKDNPAIHAITKLVVLCHHEREDGSGYPLGKGAELHIGAKIVGACDLFHALISNRCYRPGLPVNEVVAIAQNEPINPKIRAIIEHSLAYYPVGCMVLLNDGSVGIVEQNFAADVKRPLVRVIRTNCDGNKQDIYKIDLRKETNYYIKKRYMGKI